MKIFTIKFRVVEEEYAPKRVYVSKNAKGTVSKLYIDKDKGLLVTEQDVNKYWEYGGGYESIQYVGEMEDSYFKPVLSEVDFVEDQIKSKKNGETIGFQN